VTTADDNPITDRHEEVCTTFFICGLAPYVTEELSQSSMQKPFGLVTNDGVGVLQRQIQPVQVSKCMPCFLVANARLQLDDFLAL
jgi:hypothetical protein